MANFINRDPTSGNLLVMPKDDFYQMPYSWYYGTDTFIENMVSRNVINPNGQGYGPASNELLSADGLFQKDLITHNWRGAETLAQVMGSRFVLVRGDINADFPGKSITNPMRLISDLESDPNVRLIKRAGPLDLFAFRRALGTPKYPITVNSKVPRLRILSELPLGSALVSSSVQAGIPDIVQIPFERTWSIQGESLIDRVQVPVKRKYKVISFSGTQVSTVSPASKVATLGGIQIQLERSKTKTDLLFDLPLGNELLANGSFSEGSWGSVSNCAAFSGQSTSLLTASVVGHGGPEDAPYLELSSREDSACESKKLSWTAGSIVISLADRNVTGAAPRFCLLETLSTGKFQCAATSDLPSKRSWTAYRAIIQPPKNTMSLTLFLYADSYFQGENTKNDYANIKVFGAPALSSELFVLAASPHPRTPSFISDHYSFTSQFVGPGGARHVLVDGLVNGWISSKRTSFFIPYYDLSHVDTIAQVFSVVFIGALFCLIVRNRARRIQRLVKKTKHTR
jgi:hypothetical protein